MIQFPLRYPCNDDSSRDDDSNERENGNKTRKCNENEYRAVNGISHIKWHDDVLEERIQVTANII